MGTQCFNNMCCNTADQGKLDINETVSHLDALFCLAIMQPKLKQKAEHITCKTIFLKKEKPALTRQFLLNQLLGFKNKTQRALLQHVTHGYDICTGF